MRSPECRQMVRQSLPCWLQHGCVPEVLCENPKPALLIFPGPQANSGSAIMCCQHQPLNFFCP